MKFCLCGEPATVVTKQGPLCSSCFQEETKFNIKMSNKPRPKQSKLKKFKTTHSK